MEGRPMPGSAIAVPAVRSDKVTAARAKAREKYIAGEEGRRKVAWPGNPRNRIQPAEVAIMVNPTAVWCHASFLKSA
jgi:hypothetical protein